MWIEFNDNPAGRRVGDCAVRAVSKALDIDWETAYSMIASAGFAIKFAIKLPSKNASICFFLLLFADRDGECTLLDLRTLPPQK